MAIKGDPFRREYGTLTDKQKKAVEEVKIQYESVWALLTQLQDDTGPSRDMSLAKTKLQESCMWAVRAITKMPGQE